jgi:hypothetical protein
LTTIPVIFALTTDLKNMKHLMNWGAVLGLALIGVSLVLYLLDMTEASWAQWVSYALIAAAIYIGTQSKRTANNGFISYGQALGTGAGIAFFASIIVAFYTYVFFHFIDPEMLEELILRAEEQLYEKGMPDDQIEMAMTWTRKFMMPGPMAAMVVVSYTVVGFIVSLITSAILKKEDTSFESNFK